MSINSTKITSLISKVPVLAILLLAFALGYLFKGVVSTPAPPASSARASEETPKPKRYACAMFCVPPRPMPGDCPICGMEMVEQKPGGDDLGPRGLTLSPRAQKLAEIEVAPVERRFVEAEIRMVGKVNYDETRLKYITSWVPGRLDRLYVDYTGVPVSEGDHLVYMYSPELLVAQVELLQAIETAKELKTSASESVRESAEALVGDVREKLRLWGLTQAQIREIEQRGKPTDHMTIYAPIGGIVVHKNANEGMYVNTGTRIYTIADLSRLWVKLDAYESDLAWLRYGQEVEFETEAYPGETFAGTIAFIDPVLSAATRTVKVRVNVDNADGRLKPQMFVRAVARAKLAQEGMIVNADLAGKWISPMHPEIVKDGPGNCDVCGMPLVRAETLGYVSPDDLEAKPPLVVPASAPLITGKRAVVYVEVPGQPGSYQGREISLGARAGDYYLVREGLAEGDRVVVNGNFKIDSAIQILAKPSMMNPKGGGPAPGHAHHGGGQAASHAEHQASEGTSHEPSATRPGRADPAHSFTAQLEPVYAAYFRTQTALSLDSREEAQKAAKDFLKALDVVDMKLLEGPAHHAWMKELEGVKKSANVVAAAADIEKARAGFALLSESMIAVARRFGTGSQTVYRVRCPMAFNDRGADWLQTKKQVANPYFGSAMFRCGSVEETIGTTPLKKSEGGEHD